MPNFTKKAIKDSMKKLLNERPLNQITVKDIVEDCGIIEQISHNDRGAVRASDIITALFFTTVNTVTNPQ